MPPKRTLHQKRACDVCYRRKVQCSLPTPDGPCEWCDSRSLECTFQRDNPRKKRRSSDVQHLFQRIQELEGALLRVASTPESSSNTLNSPEESTLPVPSNISTSHASTVASGGEAFALGGGSLSPTTFVQTPNSSYDHLSKENSAKTHQSAGQWGPNWYFNGIPMSTEQGREWLSKRTGQPVSWADFSIPIMKSGASVFQQICSHGSRELPDQEVTREIMTAFFKSSFRLAFPVLDEVLFQTTIETAYGPMEDSMYTTIQISAIACVLSILAIAPRLDMPRPISIPVDADICAAKARCLLLQIADDVSVTTLQTAIILQMQCVFCTDWQGATFFQSIACRIVCALRGHLCDSSNVSESKNTRSQHELHHLRTLFWLCYMLDKDISLCTGNPPLLTEFYCDIMLPDNYYAHYTYLPTFTLSMAGSEQPQSTTISPYFPGDPHLTHLKEKVYRQLLSARAVKDNDNQLLLNIRQLDDEIEHWRLSIPANFRPALFVSKSTLPNASDEGIPFIIRRMSLQLEYHHLMTIIHTTVRKCTVETSDDMPDLHSVVHSSFDLSLVASRSTLWCLRTLVGLIAEGSFRFLTFYSTAAALTLFLNIVIHPLDTQSRIDLELLISAANTIRNMPVQALTKSEHFHIRELSKFIMRLVWLGTCAVTKAEREND